MRLNRRSFLKICGLTLGTGSAAEVVKTALAEERAAYGRVLYQTSVYQRPSLQAATQGRYLPDSVQPMLERAGDWARLPDGYIPSEALQPMLAAHNRPITDEFPIWLEVSAPYAPLRAWCAPDAPLRGRLGHGAVMQGLRALVDQYGARWLGLDLGGEQIGWVQATQMQAALLPDLPAADHASLNGHKLTLYREGAAWLHLRVNRPAHLLSGTYQVIAKQAGYDNVNYTGIPWYLGARHTLTGAPLELHGVYWHNRFGTEAPSLELSILAAKALYALLEVGAPLRVG